MKYFSLFSLALLCAGEVAVSSDASAERLVVKGFYAGIPENEVRELNRLEGYCFNTVKLQFPDGLFGLKGSKLLRCSNFTVANQPASVAVGLDGSVHMMFSSASFSAVVEAFSAKYGEGSCEESTIQNRLGASFTQRLCLWNVGVDILSIRRFSSSLDQGEILLANKDVFDRSKGNAESRARRNAGDL